MTTYIDHEFSAIKRFMQKFGILTNDYPVLLAEARIDDRVTLMKEELKEFIDAADLMDLPKMADALVDLVYVTKGTAVQLGLPWEQLFAEVDAANMRKVPGLTKRNQQNDVTKPPGWEGPRIDELLVAGGFDVRNYLTPLGELDPGTLSDYPRELTTQPELTLTRSRS